MYIFVKTAIFLLLLTYLTDAKTPQEKREPINLSMVISGGVSLGAYEAGYNWAIVKILADIRDHGKFVEPQLKSVTGASAGSINALLSAMYWCQNANVEEHNSIDDNLFFNTWVKLGLKDLIIKGRDPNNKSTLFTRDTLKLKAQDILNHLNKSIYTKGCEVPLGFSVTKAKPMISEFQNAGVKIKNQHFSIPLLLKEDNGQLVLENKLMKKSTDYHIYIPNIEKDISEVVNVLFASSAFPGAFQQVKLDYLYEGKEQSSYFIDGGAYDNLPLQLAIELDPKANNFIFIDPSNMRGEENTTETQKEQEEQPIGFLNANAIPLMNAVDIFQSMRLYNAISQYFDEDSGNRLILSSRYHPITGKFLGHFGAFLSEDFRLYDYHVGVYDAIYHSAQSMHQRGYFKKLSQAQIMNRLKRKLGIEENAEANQAYELLFNTEFNPTTVQNLPENNRFTAIYNAFDHNKNDSKRYDITAFNKFLERLNLEYLQDKNSFIPKEKSQIDNWYKEPLSLMINRISTLENDYANDDENNTRALAKITNMIAWMGNNLIKNKQGFHLSLNLPEGQEETPLAKILQTLPNEITNDIKNGGLGLAYNAYWYQKKSYIDAFEAKLSYNQSDDISSFLRFDLNAFHEYSNFVKVGIGGSTFGNIESSFYDKEGFYGLNAYIDLLDIFRITYVRRFNHPQERDYIYFGLRNLPSLAYWLRQ